MDNKQYAYAELGYELLNGLIGTSYLVEYLCNKLGFCGRWVGETIGRNIIKSIECGDIYNDDLVAQIISEALIDTPFVGIDFEVENQSCPFKVKWSEPTFSQKKLLVYCKCESIEEFLYEWNRGEIENRSEEDNYLKSLLIRA